MFLVSLLNPQTSGIIYKTNLKGIISQIILTSLYYHPISLICPDISPYSILGRFPSISIWCQAVDIKKKNNRQKFDMPFMIWGGGWFLKFCCILNLKQLILHAHFRLRKLSAHIPQRLPVAFHQNRFGALRSANIQIQGDSRVIRRKYRLGVTSHSSILLGSCLTGINSSEERFAARKWRNSPGFLPTITFTFTPKDV